jgi:hypothetical protein
MVIAEVSTKRATQGFLVEDNNVVQTLPPDRANDAFHISSLPGTPWSAKDFFDVHHFKLLAELISVNLIAIS